ncbi:MAG: hypothetical protein AAFU85_17805 [Planctomycetota bacterium]
MFNPDPLHKLGETAILPQTPGIWKFCSIASLLAAFLALGRFIKDGANFELAHLFHSVSFFTTAVPFIIGILAVLNTTVLAFDRTDRHHSFLAFDSSMVLIHLVVLHGLAVTVCTKEWYPWLLTILGAVNEIWLVCKMMQFFELSQSSDPIVASRSKRCFFAMAKWALINSMYTALMIALLWGGGAEWAPLAAPLTILRGAADVLVCRTFYGDVLRGHFSTKSTLI